MLGTTIKSKHVDLFSEDSEQICKSILEDNDIPESSMYKPKDTHPDVLDESPGNEIDKIELRNTILYHKHEYKRKLELGKAVHKIVINDEVDEDELLPEHKEALDLHLKKSMETIPNNIELKPWQRKYIQPHDFR